MNSSTILLIVNVNILIFMIILYLVTVSDAYVTAKTEVSCTEDEDHLNSTASQSEPVWWDNYHQVSDMRFDIIQNLCGRLITTR